MQPSPTNVVFPSPLTTPNLRGPPGADDKAPISKPESTSSHATNDAVRLISMHRKPAQSAKGVTPISKGSSNAHRMMNLQAANRQSSKSTIFIAHQKHYIPTLEYYTKGSLLKLPSDRAKAKKAASNNKTLARKTFKSIDPVLSPDQVSAH